MDMAKSKNADVRVRVRATVTLGHIEITNHTSNSITVRKTAKGVVVTDCCLEEQGR